MRRLPFTLLQMLYTVCRRRIERSLSEANCIYTIMPANIQATALQAKAIKPIGTICGMPFTPTS